MTLVMLCTPRKVAFLVATTANMVGGKKLSVVPTRDPIANFSTLLVLQQREPTLVSLTCSNGIFTHLVTTCTPRDFH